MNPTKPDPVSVAALTPIKIRDDSHMGFLDKINEFLGKANAIAERAEGASQRWLEETRIRIAAQDFIKTDNFSSDL